MKKIAVLFFSLMVSLVLAEVVLRILGMEPTKKSSSARIRSSPKSLFEEDSVFGYTNATGNYEVTLNNRLVYTLTIDSLHARVAPGLLERKSPILAVYGCSFFAGMGVNDTNVLSYYLQQKTNDFRVINYAIPGHGMTSQFLQIKQQAESTNPPKVAIFSVASFHLQRNPGAVVFLKNFNSITNAPVRFVKAYFEADSLLRTKVMNVPPGGCFFSEKSSLAALISNAVGKREYSDSYQLELQLCLMDSAYAICRSKKIFPLFVMITNDEMSNKIFSYCKRRHYNIIRSGVDYKNDKFNLMPEDGHPNVYAHGLYADEIYSYLRKHVLKEEK